MAKIGIKKIKLSLFAKTFLAICAIFILIAVSISLFFGWTLYRALMSEYQSKGTAIAKSIADSSVTLILTQDSATIQQVIDQFKTISGVAYVSVRNGKNEMIAHTFVPEIPQKLHDAHRSTISSSLTDKITTQALTLPYLGHVLDITAPILSGQVGFVHVGMSTEGIVHSIWVTFFKIQGILVILFLLSLAGMYVFIRKISKPLQRLSHYTESLARYDFVAPDSLQKEVEGIALTSSDEVGSLASAFSTLNSELSTYIHTLKETTAAKEKIESELAIARDIQTNMLPKLLAIQGPFSIYGVMHSAKEVGGDFYDFFEKDGLLFISMGDVSGKGVPAALTMAICVSLIRAAAVHTHSPEDILTTVNRQLCQNNDSAIFVTVFLATFNVVTGQLQYCLAGHPAPYLVSDTLVRKLPLTNGMALGIDENFYFQSQSLTLAMNDHLFAYTDGVIEAENGVQNLYGSPRLERCISHHARMSPQEFCEALIGDIHAFTEPAPQSDDITVLDLHWKPHHLTQTIGALFKVHFVNDISELHKLQQVVELYGAANALSTKTVLNLNLILEELLSNIIFHGYQDHEQHLIYVTFEASDLGVAFTIEDDAIAFNPLDREEIDTEQLLEDRPVGGLGIHFIKALARDLIYERVGERNVLRGLV